MQCAVHNDPRPGRRKGIKQQKRNKEKKVYGQLRLKGRGGQLVCIGHTHGENATFFIIIIIIFLYLNTWTGSVVRFRHLQIEKELGRFRNRPSAQEQRRRLRNRTGEFGGLWKPTYIYTNGVCYISLILFDSGHWKERGGGTGREEASRSIFRTLASLFLCTHFPLQCNKRVWIGPGNRGIKECPPFLLFAADAIILVAQ